MTPVDQLEDMSTSYQTNATSTETSVEVAGNYEMANKIDRLSLLPNEILDHIFDLAYSINTPSTGPLSKHLLPFHITGIYRRISLSKGDNITKLVRKINKSRSLARLVKSLQIDCEEDLDGVFEVLEATEFQQFFLQLVHLEWLDLGRDHYKWLDKLTSAHIPASISPLHHITSGASSRTPQPLLDFVSFPALRSLHVTTYERKYQAFETSMHSSLPLLTHLTISGLYAESISIASFCILCPALTHLTLHCTAPDYPPLLRVLPTSLVTLELFTGIDQEAILCGQEFSRFTALRHLSIGSFLFSYDLPTHLDNLIDLETLELGEGHVSTEGIARLVPKLPLLRYLKLDLFRGYVGSRMEVGATGCTGAKGLPAEGERIADNWVVPDFARFEGDGTTLQAARKMLGEVRETEVQMEGSIFEAVNVMEAYYLEIANVAIYRCFRDKTFDPYMEVRTHNLGDRLPPLNLDSLDPNNLKLVKTDLPDEGWFALSLEPRED